MALVVKTDGMLAVEHAQRSCFDGLGVDFVDRPCLSEEELIETCADADGLLVLREPLTAAVVSRLRRCRIIARFGVGLDSIDVAAATDAGIRVTNVPDSNHDEVATHTMAMLLGLCRGLPHYDRMVRAGEWDALGGGMGIRRPDTMVLGLLGAGRIGRLVARRAACFGIRVWAHDPHLPTDRLADLGIQQVDLDSLLAGADVVSLHLPLTDSTSGLIDERALNTMKAGAILINVSRGGLVDEEALAAALRRGHLSAAGIDTLSEEPPRPDHPLLGLPNVMLSPHAAHYSEQSYAEVRTKAFADVAAVLRGQQPRYPVN